MLRRGGRGCASVVEGASVHWKKGNEDDDDDDEKRNEERRPDGPGIYHFVAKVP
ncbi:hypothetical protein K0M31_006974 [Melipona bicolor]|uniref:Uncharacterized protein n=1 Tax=Melipona bicolor TaxID=60889 RepID=A0AA40FRE1_9HYME|nr:hypothetical protein K0M31_006974 [Melipona bicolor]